MKLSAPTVPVFIIAVVLALAGLLGSLGYLAPAAGNAFWLMTAGFVVLAVACVLKGL